MKINSNVLGMIATLISLVLPNEWQRSDRGGLIDAKIVLNIIDRDITSANAASIMLISLLGYLNFVLALLHVYVVTYLIYRVSYFDGLIKRLLKHWQGSDTCVCIQL